MKCPTVSVTMTVYNAGSYLEVAVGSILAQTYTDFEFVIIDDGSTDDSLRRLERFAACDDRVHLVSRPNTGISRARNDALSLARGQFVAVMDADDVAHPERLEREVSYLQNHPTVVCAGTWYEVIDSAGRRLTYLKPPTTNEAVQVLLLKGHTAICQSTSMLRRGAMLRAGGFDEALAPSEDLDLYLKLGELGELANIPETLLKYRVHDSSASASARARQFASSRTACENAWKRRGINGKFEPSEPWRPGETRESKYKWALKCGWWAFQTGERKTASVYGLKAIATLPHRTGGWRLLACSAATRNGH